jgi:small GTP-binding protein
MDLKRATSGFFLLVLLAGLGVVLIMVPSWIAGQVDTVRQIGPDWLVYAYLAVVGTGGVLLVGCTLALVGRLWARTARKKKRRVQRDKSPSQLSAADREREVADNLTAAEDMRAGLPSADALRDQLGPLQRKIEEKRESQKLEIVAFGAISSGKSSLLNALAGRDIFQADAKGGTTVQRNEVPWPGSDQVVLVDTPGLGEVDGAARGGIAAESAKDADMVLLVLDGPLREWEFKLLGRLGEMEKRVVVCLNKQDWYDASDRQALLGQIQTQVKDYVRSDDLVSIRSRTTTRSRVRVMPDGTQSDEEVDVPVDISPLAERMLKIVKQDGRDLLLANLLLQSRGLVSAARQRVEDSLDQRAAAIVDRYMWGAGGAAALTPFPIIDLVAGCAISTKMVVDLGHVYRQDIDLDAALKLLGELGKNLISIMGATAATPLVAAGVGSLLKAVPGVGTIAGQLLQGVVQAVITRWIGAVFIAYFKNQMQQPEGGLTALARREWERLTTIDELRRLVTTARRRLTDESAEDDG